ncbi:hypothetical protein [Propionispira raffinosivorans]|jgi:hypothetical protein|uniref:hypothetical protein n=1 Tax=Propionispira raffinosivorans TaxID=86959 RepID=UPI00036AD365|nr:hypothetical protein [Propionispira raffinosivorans]
MTSAIDRARRLARKAQEKTYEGRCTVTEYGKVKDPVTHITEEKDITAYKDQACRLSYSSAPATGPSQTADSLEQSITLFIAPDLVIKPGSKINVVQNGRTEAYKQSGKAAVYSTHQEINLELYEEHP